MEGNRSSSRLKDRLARMFRPASLLRSSCNTSTSSVAAAVTKNPSSANSSSRALLTADAIAHEPVFLASSRRHDSAVGRIESFSAAVDRLHRRRSFPPLLSRLSVDDVPPPIPEEKKKERRIRETGGLYETGQGEGRVCPPASPSRSSRYSAYHHRLIGIKNDKSKKLSSNPYGFSTSPSDDADTDGGDVFSSDDERDNAKKEETEPFFSSRSFSSDSSDFYTKKKKSTKNQRKNHRTSQPSKPPPPLRRRRSRRAPSCNTCNVKEGFRPLVTSVSSSAASCGRDQKTKAAVAPPAEEEHAAVRKGFAVVKRSSDPYGDFRTSMVEMIVERQIFGAAELERLLRSYLSLNAPHHHPVILQAFSDIWVVLHGG